MRGVGRRERWRLFDGCACPAARSSARPAWASAELLEAKIANSLLAISASPPRPPSPEHAEVFRFARTAATPYAIAIAEITPEELARIERGELALPNGWSLETATRRNRPQPG